jgi:hypothetical protein
LKPEVIPYNIIQNLMKNRILTGFLLLLAVAVSGCSGSPGKDARDVSVQKADTAHAVLVFSDYSHDFGKVSEGEKVGFIFPFENRGSGNLVIASATASCGCTVPKYDSKPVPPGGSGNLEVVFDTSGRNGKQTKTITVASNASKPLVLLQITAEVVSAPDK